MRGVIAACLGLLFAGCVQVEGFDPVGNIAAVAGSWEIDSLPPSSAACEALGADRVRLTFLDGQRPVAHSGLFFRCDEGSFTTVGSGGAVIAAGRWTVRLDAIDSSGNLMAAGPCADVEVAADCGDGLPVVSVGTASFLSATISAGFRIAGQDPDQERCDAAGISDVSLVFDDLGGGAVDPRTDGCGTSAALTCDGDAGPGGGDAGPGGGDAGPGGGTDAGSPAATASTSEPCAAGFVGVRVAPGHTYRVRVRALDASGSTIRETDARDVTVAAGAHVELDASGTIELGL